MSEPSPSPPLPYRVVYSDRVRSELRALLERAAVRGVGEQALQAAKAIDARLRVYPQFGEPLRDLPAVGQTLWAGVVPPLTGRYLLDEARRLVFVGVPFKPLRGSGF